MGSLKSRYRSFRGPFKHLWIERVGIPMRDIYIMAGGPTEHVPDLTALNKPMIWVGVDKGISTLLAKGIMPDIVFGDFDSVDQASLKVIQHVEKYQYPAEKDDTDLALALDWALQQKPDRILIFGNTGGRMDHTLAGVQLLLQDNSLRSKTIVQIVDESNVIAAFLPGVYSVAALDSFKYISFFSMTAIVSDLTLRGFKYPLMNKELRLGDTLCVSNELILESGHFSFTDGILLMVRSMDK